MSDLLPISTTPSYTAPILQVHLSYYSSQRTKTEWWPDMTLAVLIGPERRRHPIQSFSPLTAAILFYSLFRSLIFFLVCCHVHCRLENGCGSDMEQKPWHRRVTWIKIPSLFRRCVSAPSPWLLMAMWWIQAEHNRFGQWDLKAVLCSGPTAEFHSPTLH